MPQAKFFQGRGFFSSPGFLDATYCDRLRRRMDSASGHFALVGGAARRLDRDARNVVELRVGERTRGHIRRKIQALLPQMSRRFRVSLDGDVQLTFLRYRKGGFYRPHVDRASESKAPREMRRRAVSLVIFLSDEAEKPGRGRYGGGSLMLYGVLKGGPFAKCALALRAEKGLLFSFRSDRKHAVSPVTHGARYAIVAWCSGTLRAAKA